MDRDRLSRAVIPSEASGGGQRRDLDGFCRTHDESCHGCRRETASRVDGWCGDEESQSDRRSI